MAQERITDLNQPKTAKIVCMVMFVAKLARFQTKIFPVH